MRLFPSIKNLTREQIQERFDQACERFLRSRDAESRSEVIELHERLKELDDEKRARIPVLQLRDHPLMKRNSGYVVLSPRLVQDGNDKSVTLTGEIGYLEGILRNEDREALNKLLFLTINHDGSKYIGAMSFDDSAFCGQLHQLLKSKIGLSIKEIGDLDLSHLL